jgi:hypothetical protein
VVFFGFSTNKTDRYDITEILWKVVLNTIKQTDKQTNKHLGMEYNLLQHHDTAVM